MEASLDYPDDRNGRSKRRGRSYIMWTLNPFYLLAPPALVLFSLPLTIFAGFTTVLALNLLAIRVVVVYAELGLNIASSLVFPAQRPEGKAPRPVFATSPEEVKLRRRRSSMSFSSSGSVLETANEGATRRSLHKAGSFVSLLTQGSGVRDYEGVGGWRDVDNDEDDSTWLGLNSRLRLPERHKPQSRNHHRSLTAGSSRYSMGPELIRMSPVQSRARTPSLHSLVDQPESISGTASPEEYFGLHPHGRAAVEATPIPGHVDGLGLGVNTPARRKSIGERISSMHSSGVLRRKSTSADSSSSSSSGRSSHVTIKQTSFR